MHCLVLDGKTSTYFSLHVYVWSRNTQQLSKYTVLLKGNFALAHTLFSSNKYLLIDSFGSIVHYIRYSQLLE